MTKFDIVIPTLNRCEYLKYPIMSCLNQSYDEFSVIICDNNSDDKTEEVVKAFDDDRIKYLKNPCRTCMSLNWNYALKDVLKKVKGDYTIFIGDDDGLMPNSLKIVANLVEKYDYKIIRPNYAEYIYPDVIDPKAGLMLARGNISGKLILKNSLEQFKKVCNFDYWYINLPLLYHGFIPTNLIKNLSKNTGDPFFRKATPDVYSDCLFAASNQEYIDLDLPLTMNGVGKKSNGVNYLSKKSEIGYTFHNDSIKELEHNYALDLINLEVLDSIEDVIDILELDEFKKYINYHNAYLASLKEAANKPIYDMEMVIASLTKISGKDRKKVIEDLTYSKNHTQESNLRRILAKMIGKEKNSLIYKYASRYWRTILGLKRREYQEYVNKYGIYDALAASQFLYRKYDKIYSMYTS